MFVGGAPPGARAAGEGRRICNLHVTHLYGLTETYGPIAVCAWNPDWDDLPADEQAALRARQGVGTIVSERMRVVDEDMEDVPADGESLGEVCMRGDNVMTGYYRDEEATEEAFKGGWFHSGDLGVVHPDGYVELRDRLKDVIISGGENIATIEVEQALAAHPSVSEVAVVAAPDERWGEVPVAFVTAAGAEHARGGRAAGLRARAARPLQGAQADRGRRRAAQDRHGQDPEVPAARAGGLGSRTCGSPTSPAPARRTRRGPRSRCTSRPTARSRSARRRRSSSAGTPRSCCWAITIETLEGVGVPPDPGPAGQAPRPRGARSTSERAAPSPVGLTTGTSRRSAGAGSLRPTSRGCSPTATAS